MLSYVLPLRSEEPRPDLTAYLHWLARHAEVIVVDGSAPEVFDTHAAWWGATIRHLPVSRHRVTPMGKVGGVLTGLDHAHHDGVVIADDDVRCGESDLLRLEALLEYADVVRPQNVFTDLPWHAWLDTGRMLLARASGGDWPGTLALRRDALAGADGYAGDVMFENLELVRTVRALGGREHVALDLAIPRIPPGVRHFCGQRIRQAYDEFARPARLVAALSVVPAVLVGGRRVAVALALASMIAAEAGRRRGGGRSFYPASTIFAAPIWVAERAVTSWLAVGCHMAFGGIRYGGGTLRRAASSERALRRRFAPDVHGLSVGTRSARRNAHCDDDDVVASIATLELQHVIEHSIHDGRR